MFKESKNCPEFYDWKMLTWACHIFSSMMGEIEDEKAQHFLFRSTLQKYFCVFIVLP